METEQLKLSDIAMYLPYDLKVKVNDPFIKDIFSIREILFTSGMPLITLELNDKYSDGLIDDCKPILRPMSDLIKPMTHPNINDGKEFIPLDYWGENDDLGTTVVSMLTKIENEEDIIKVWQTTSYTNSIETQFLAKLHFDFNGLIEKGLAIDINTLNK